MATVIKQTGMRVTNTSTVKEFTLDLDLRGVEVEVEVREHDSDDSHDFEWEFGFGTPDDIEANEWETVQDFLEKEFDWASLNNTVEEEIPRSFPVPPIAVESTEERFPLRRISAVITTHIATYEVDLEVVDYPDHQYVGFDFRGVIPSQDEWNRLADFIHNTRW